MATSLLPGDIAIVQYNTTTTDAFTFVFLRDVEVGTVVTFSDNGWLASGGFRSGEGTVTYTAPGAIAAGTVVTLTGLNLDDAGDQIIAYQGDPTAPTILHVVDFADGDNSVAGDAINDNTTALPPGFALNVNAVAVAFDNSLYVGPTDGSPAELFAAISDADNWLSSDVLPLPFASNIRPIVDLDADNSTQGGTDYRAQITSGGPAVGISDSDVAISDGDGTTITEAEIQVKDAVAGDVLSIIGVLPGTITTSGYDPGTGILRLTGAASHADYEAAILQIAFSTTAAVGTQKQIEVGVFDGQGWSSQTKAFITVSGTLTNTQPPVLDLDADDSNGGGVDYTASFTSGGPAIPIADTDVSITDADTATIASATITIGVNRQSDDVLSIVGALPPGITASLYGSGTGVITLTGSATLSEYQTALHQVAYSSTNPTPFTADRIITVTVNDGTLDSNVATTYMHVAAAPADVPPVLNLDPDSSTIGGVDYLTTFTDGGAAVAIVDTDVSITDSDDTELTSATVTLTNPDTDDVLLFNGTPPPGISASAYDPVTGVLSLTGAATLAAYQAALQQLTSDNTGTTPSTTARIVDVVVNDGTAASNLAQAFIQVAQVDNTAPVVDLDADNSTVGGTSYRATFTEGGPPIAIADTDSLITDTDSTNLVSATVTLADPQAGDVLAISGALPGGIIASVYDPGTGVLTLTGAASLADYETALEAIRFSTGEDNPIAGNRTIDVVVSDGTNDSQAATALLTIQAVNDAPALAAANATYQENAAPILLSPSASVTDADETELTFGAVQITTGSFPGDGDVLSIAGATSGTSNGITFNWNPTFHTLFFSGASSVANYQALLQSIEFRSTSDNPTDFDASPQRNLTWVVSDGATFTTTTTTLDIVPVNDPTAILADVATGYTENAPPLTISPGLITSDIDNLNLVGGEVRIIGALDGDLLSVNGLQSGTFLGIDFSYDAIEHSLTFTRPTSIADYQAFLDAVQFQSTSDDPTNGGLNPSRVISWGASDGEAISNVWTTTILIAAVDDPTVVRNDAVATTEDTAIVTGNVFADNGFGPDSDPDSAFSVTAVSAGAIGTQLTLPSGALLTVNADGTFSYDPNHKFDYLPTPGSGASDLTVTDTFTYTVTGGNTATVTVTVSGVDTNDILLDSAGIDTLAGGIGNDVYLVTNTADVVIEAAGAGSDWVAASVDYTLPASNTVEVLNMRGSGLIGTGTNGAETFVSSSGPNTLIGLGGNDTYYVNSPDDVVIEAANGGIDLVGSTVDYTLPADGNVEGLFMRGSGLTGTGSDHADALLSSGGPNTLVGLGGDDLYYVTNTADVVIEAAGAGFDWVAASVDYTLPASNTVEVLNMLGSGLIGTGTNGAETFVSSSGPNTLIGLGGNDTYYVNSPDDVVIEAANGG